MPTGIDDLTPEQRREMLKRLLRNRQEQGVVEYPLSAGQRALWFLHRLAPSSSVYNIVSAMRLRPGVDVKRFQDALNAVIRGHEALRAVFPESNGVPIQRVLPALDIQIDREDARDLSESELYSRIKDWKERPFDLATGPLLRARLFDRIGEQVFVLVVHHIVFDGWSGWILWDDLRRHYEGSGSDAGKASPTAPRSYRDFVAAEMKYVNGADGAASLAFWESHLARPLPALSLPADFPRPEVQRFVGASRSLLIDEDTLGRLRVLAGSEASTLFTVLATGYVAALQGWTGDSEFVVGVPVAGRGDGLFDDVIGCFVNVAPVRLRIAPDMTFREAMKSIKSQLLSALHHARYPFSRIVAHVQPERDLSRSPLFQTTFNMFRPGAGSGLRDICASATDGGETPKFGSCDIEVYPLRHQEGAFDLSIDLVEMRHKIVGQFNYSSDLFRADTAERMAAQYVSLLHAAADHPELCVQELFVGTEREEIEL